MAAHTSTKKGAPHNGEAPISFQLLVDAGYVERQQERKSPKMRATRSMDSLSSWVLEELRATGFEYRDGLLVETAVSKDDIRNLHARQRGSLLRRAGKFVAQWQGRLIHHYANGADVEPSAIDPKIIPVRTKEQAALFKYTSLHWSVPVSAGYGRRTRFLVVDKQNDALIGIFALGDPVYNLKVRDELIGWDINGRNARLYNILDAFVMGAVPPYRQLIGGKLIAMAAASDTTRDYVGRKYRGQLTEIQRRIKDPVPVLITTTSALGRSSIYNRLTFRGYRLYHSIGYTKGFGHFHFSDQLFAALTEFLRAKGLAPGNQYGCGPSWKIRTLRIALTKLGLNPELIQHGIQREVFLAPLASNWQEYLRGETVRRKWLKLRLGEMAAYYRERWAVPRASRDKSYLQVDRSSMLLMAGYQTPLIESEDHETW